MSIQKGLLLFLAIIGFMVLGALIGRALFPKKESQYFEGYTFKPDTTKKEGYQEPKAKGDSIPPKIVVVHDTVPIPTPVLIECKDSIIYLKDTSGHILSEINPDYLKYRPGAPKLLYATFTGQGFSLDLLDTSGKVYTTKYETDYSSFDYFFNGRNITYSSKRARTIPQITTGKKILTTSSNAYFLYDPFNKVPTIRADYSILFKDRVGIYGEGSAGYSPKLAEPEFRLNLGVKVKLK